MKMGWKWGTVFAVAIGMGILTLFPSSTVSKVCFLGYKAHCSFTPVSTAICVAITYVIYWQGRKREK